MRFAIFAPFDTRTGQALSLERSPRQEAIDRKTPLYMGSLNKIRTIGMSKFMMLVWVDQPFTGK